MLKNDLTKNLKKINFLINDFFVLKILILSQYSKKLFQVDPFFQSLKLTTRKKSWKSFVFDFCNNSFCFLKLKKLSYFQEFFGKRQSWNKNQRLYFNWTCILEKYYFRQKSMLIYVFIFDQILLRKIYKICKLSFSTKGCFQTIVLEPKTKEFARQRLKFEQRGRRNFETCNYKWNEFSKLVSNQIDLSVEASLTITDWMFWANFNFNKMPIISNVELGFNGGPTL